MSGEQLKFNSVEEAASDQPENTAQKLSQEELDWQRDILESGDANDAYQFANYASGADVRALQQVIVNHGDGWYAYYFARDIPGADIHDLQQMVLDRGEGVHAYWFAKDIPDADITALQHVVLSRGDGRDVYRFARDIDDADMPTLHTRLVEMLALDADDGYLDMFNQNVAIQCKLREKLTGVADDQTDTTLHTLA